MKALLLIGLCCSSPANAILTSGWRSLLGFDVTRNIIEMLPDPLSVAQEGISTTNNGGTAIHRFYGNTLRGNAALINKAGAVAIYSSACDNLRVVRNTCSDAAEGIKFDMNNTNTRFACNTLSNHKFGFVLSNNGIIGTQPFGFTPQSADNQWTGTGWSSTTILKTFTDNSSAVNSRMYIRNVGTANNYNPNFSGRNAQGDPLKQYFYDGTANSNLLAATGNINCGPSQMRVAVGSQVNPADAETGGRKQDITLLERIVLDQLPYYCNVPETKFIYKHQIYDLLQSDTTLCDSSAILRSFKNQSKDKCIGQLQSIEKALAAGNTAQAANLNNSLDLLHPTERKYQSYYRIYMKYLSCDTLNTSDSKDLYNIAKACPFTDGTVVYKARAFYNSLQHTFKLFPNDCPHTENITRYGNTPEQDEKQLAIAQNGEVFDVVVYPNPSKEGQLQIATYGKIPGAGMYIEALDVTGKKVYQAVISSEGYNSTVKIDVREGIYFLIITNMDTHEAVVKKVAVYEK